MPLAEAREPMLELDPVLFEQVLFNLLDNAAKYASPQTTVLIDHMGETGKSRVEPKVDAEDDWIGHVNEVAGKTLRSTCSSWYVGTNIPGRPRVFMPYIGGFPVYVQKCNEVMSGGFEGFVIEGAPASNAEPKVRLTERWRVPIDIDVISPAAIAARRVPMV